MGEARQDGVGVTEGHGEAIVDLGAVRTNLRLVAGRTDSDVMAVVKADAFGHGAPDVARAAVASGVTWLGVATPAEAAALRQVEELSTPILCWLYPPHADLVEVVGRDVRLSVASTGQVGAVVSAARRVGTTARVHAKVDSGLSRNGVPVAEWPAFTQLLRSLERQGLIEVEGVWSHLLDADGPAPPSVSHQVAVLEDAVTTARRSGLRPRVVHLANTAGALHYPATHLDLVRVGIGLYGVEPVPSRPTGLRPAMTLRAPLVLTKPVPAGTGVSYHHHYVTRKPTTLGLVALGYGDGIPRSASGRAEVAVDGVRRPVAGTICMDQFVVDLGADPPVAEGDAVTVFGPGDSGEPTVVDWATWAGTIPHEILSRLGDRVRRRSVAVSGGYPRTLSPPGGLPSAAVERAAVWSA